MATLTIPITYEYSSYDFQLDLEGATYLFTFRYNARADRWFMNISDENENVLIAGVPLITNYNLLAPYKNAKLPPGRFYMYDETGAERTAGREDFGTTIKLFYVESEA